MTSRASSALSILCFLNSAEIMTLSVSHSFIHHPFNYLTNHYYFHTNRDAQHCGKFYIFSKNKHRIQTSKRTFKICQNLKKQMPFWLIYIQTIHLFHLLRRKGMPGESHEVTKLLKDSTEMKYFHQRCLALLTIDSDFKTCLYPQDNSNQTSQSSSGIGLSDGASDHWQPSLPHEQKRKPTSPC